MIPGRPSAQGDIDVHVLSTEARKSRLWCVVYLEGKLVPYLQ